MNDLAVNEGVSNHDLDVGGYRCLIIPVNLDQSDRLPGRLVHGDIAEDLSLKFLISVHSGRPVVR